MQAVIFDMDGTLIDSERVCQSSWRHAASDLGITLSAAILHAFVGCSIPNAKKIIDEEFGDPALTKRLFDHQANVFKVAIEHDLELKPGAVEAIVAAKAHGLRVALATSNAREHSIATMERFGVMDSFDVAVFREDIQNHKPAPDVYLTAAERLGVDPAQCIAVEDSFNGVRAGAAAGMRVVMIPDFNEPTSEIRELCSEVLPNLLQLPGALSRLTACEQ